MNKKTCFSFRVNKVILSKEKLRLIGLLQPPNQMCEPTFHNKSQFFRREQSINSFFLSHIVCANGNFTHVSSPKYEAPISQTCVHSLCITHPQCTRSPFPPHVSTPSMHKAPISPTCINALNTQGTVSPTCVCTLNALGAHFPLMRKPSIHEAPISPHVSTPSMRKAPTSPICVYTLNTQGTHSPHVYSPSMRKAPTSPQICIHPQYMRHPFPPHVSTPSIHEALISPTCVRTLNAQSAHFPHMCTHPRCAW